MPGTNATIIHNAIADYKTAIFDEVEKRCRKFCTDLCQEAIKARQNNEAAHNYTGNLINSIVVCLYRDKEPINAYYAAQYVPKAIQVKMRLRKRKHYRFNPDYDGEKSHYLPEVQTNGGWGEDDARNFWKMGRSETCKHWYFASILTCRSSWCNLFEVDKEIDRYGRYEITTVVPHLQRP